MAGVNAALDIMAGIGQMVVILVLAVVLYRIGKFVDALSDMIKKG